MLIKFLVVLVVLEIPLRILSALYPDELSKLAVGKRVRWALPEPLAQLRILSPLYPDELSKLAVGNIVHWAFIYRY